MSHQPPERLKTDEEMTPDDWVAYRDTGERPERPEYVEIRRQALAEKGLEDADDHSKPIEQMTPSDHARRRFGRP